MSTITGITLSPNDIIGPTNISATLTVNLSSASASTPLITIEPSYIANLDGNMTSSDGGLTWNGSINRTPGMNLLGNTLTVTSGDISSNIAFDVLENGDNKMWSLTNSNNVNKEFNQSIQMSPNGLLMGLIDGSNVAIYRKSESSYTWNHDVSYNGHTFALTNNHIVLANNEFLQIYDYSGASWSIMNGGNIYYLNIIALSINLDGTYVAISNNIDVKVLQNISDNWTHINTYSNGSVIGLSLSPNGLKLGMGIGTVGQDYSSIVIEDVVNNHPPVITLLGDAIVSFEINSGTYIDAGATAIDNYGNDITDSINIVNNIIESVIGTYTVTYNVTDINGNNAIEVIRTVNVVIPRIQDVRYVRLVLNNNYLHFTELQIYDNTGTNIAPTGKATQISTYLNHPDLGADALIRGDLDGSDGYQGNHTNRHDEPWWELELTSDVDIFEARLYITYSLPQERVNNTKVQFMNSDKDIIYEFDIGVWGTDSYNKHLHTIGNSKYLLIPIP